MIMKKYYEMPQIEVMHAETTCGLLAGSGLKTGIEMPIEGEITPGDVADSRWCEFLFGF